MTDRALAVDVGGTKIAVGVVERSGHVADRARFDTPKTGAEDVVDMIVRAVKEVGVGRLPIGVGAAGLVDRSGRVLYAPNLAWQDYPLRDELQSRLGRAVVVENDANAAAWGEYRVGAGRRAAEFMVMLTVGTGVGGGLVVQDRLARGANGLGAEFGHLIVAEGARRCSCGNRGCLEAMASGTAIARTVEEWAAAGRVPCDSALGQLDEVTGTAVGEAAQRGDETAIAAVAECGRWLGVGIASIVNGLDPETVVVGGGVAELGDLLLIPAVAAFEERLMGRAHRRATPVVRGLLGGDAGLVGAGLLAIEEGGG